MCGGLDHFQVVFTLPSQLSRLSLDNRKVIYNLLFRASWSALKQAIIEEHSFEPAALMVLHTWNQKLDAHGHVHAVVPSCGISREDGQLVFAQRNADSSTRGKYLVDAVQLRTLYRKKFLAGLKRLHRRGLLKLERLAIQLAQTDLPLADDALQFGPFEEASDISGNTDSDRDDSADGEPNDNGACPECPVCKTALIPQRFILKPSWSTVMASRHRPSWYLRL